TATMLAPMVKPKEPIFRMGPTLYSYGRTFVPVESLSGQRSLGPSILVLECRAILERLARKRVAKRGHATDALRTPCKHRLTLLSPSKVCGLRVLLRVFFQHTQLRAFPGRRHFDPTFAVAFVRVRSSDLR